MFNKAIVFDQNISVWNVENVSYHFDFDFDLDTNTFWEDSEKPNFP